MSKDTLKVLSIDFDYFQIVDEDVMTSVYPDGHDHSTHMSEIVWFDKYFYTEPNEKLMTVKMNKTEMGILKSLLKKQNPTTDVLVVNSHKLIYDEIKTKMKHKDALHIDHIDMHHDMFNDNPEVDCGNWLSHLYDEYTDMSVNWVANPISREVFGLDSPRFDMIKSSIAELGDTEYDFIFLCRSDAWLPPHLDTYFNKLFSFMCDIFPFLRYTENISKVRDICYKSFISYKDSGNMELVKKAYEELSKSSGIKINVERKTIGQLITNE